MTQPSPAGGFGGAVSPQRGPGWVFFYINVCIYLCMYVCTPLMFVALNEFVII